MVMLYLYRDNSYLYPKQSIIYQEKQKRRYRKFKIEFKKCQNLQTQNKHGLRKTVPTKFTNYFW